MTRGESATLLAALGLDLSPRQLDSIVARTEGWPAALYLAGLAFADAPDLSRAIARFAGDDRVVIDYMREEFLQPVSRRRLTFLRQASVLDRLCGELCDAALGREDSAAVLRDLSRSNILLIPLDRKDRWYRFHPLLQDMLQAELRESEPREERDLHLRASAWWDAQGEWDQAIRHAIEAGAPGRAGELLWAAFPEYETRGMNASVLAWLERLGESDWSRSAGLSLVAAWAHVTLGRAPLAEHWGAIAARVLAAEEPSELTPSMEAGLALLDAVLCRSGLASMRDSAAAVEPLLDEESPWRTISCLVDGVGLHLLGQASRARERLQEGIRRGSVGAPNVQTVCLAQLALILIEEGEWDAAEGEIARARAQIERYGLTEYPMTALPFAISAFVRARRGSIEAATEDLATAKKRLGELEHFTAWYEIEVRLALAQASARLGDRDEARRFLAEAGRRLVEVPDGVSLRRRLEGIEAAVAQETMPTGARLTAAELRILQFLPSHRSFPQIAALVHVSPNTVKTQVRSIYTKFGVSSRQDAVECARRAGLLDDHPSPG
jgi:LuxR family maltose regulon positive regulatory protein